MNRMLKKAEMVSLATGLARPSREEAEEAVRTLLRWAGDDPEREGLAGTPDRVVRSYEEFFAGYDQDPRDMLQRTFEEVEGYDEVVALRDIRLESHCEHHMVPIIGKVHVGYLPDKRVVGISKLARVVDAFAHRLQIQEKLTAQIANTLQEVLQPRGVAVVIEAAHQCMTTRGVHKSDVTMVTSRMLGAFRDNGETRREFLTMIGRTSSLTAQNKGHHGRRDRRFRRNAAPSRGVRHHFAQFQSGVDRVRSRLSQGARRRVRSWCRARTAARPTCSRPSGPT